MRRGFIIIIINIHCTATPYILRPAFSYCHSGGHCLGFEDSPREFKLEVAAVCAARKSVTNV